MIDAQRRAGTVTLHVAKRAEPDLPKRIRETGSAQTIEYDRTA